MNARMPPSKAETFLVSCIDPRLTDDTTFYFAALGRTDRYSEMRIAGAALAAIDEKRPAWQAALWENLDASRRLHGVSRVTFLNHRDCGALDLWAGRRLAENPVEELRLHQEVLTRAAEAVRRRYPEMQVEIKLMELDGSVHTLPCPVCMPGRLQAEAVAPEPPAFTDLLRLRLADAPLDREAELALLQEGVVRHGMTAEQARRALQAAAARDGRLLGSAGERDVAAFLRSRSDRHGRVGRRDVAQAAQLYRRLAGRGVTQAEAGRRAVAIAEAAGLQPRPEGIRPFRSTAWFRAMAGA